MKEEHMQESMKAARLSGFHQKLKIEDVPVPKVKGKGVLVKVTAAGVCHSDLHLMGGFLPDLPLPMTLGHENAGIVAEVGADVPLLKKGDPVAVYGCWGCGTCRFCRQGEEQFCLRPTQCGITTDGGYAEYLRVPDYRHLVRLDTIDPIAAAAFTDAGLTPFRGIKKALPHLSPGDTALMIGIGGLGHMAVQILKALMPSVRIVAVDTSPKKLETALEMGADHALAAQSDAAGEIRRLTGGFGVRAVFDMVASDGTLKLAAAVAAPRSMIVILGVGTGILPYSFAAFPHEVAVTGSTWGTMAELEELLSLAKARSIRPITESYPLEEINRVYELMESGEITGRAVIVP
jgi:propanol-preferring alcohol dehydrogenase